MTNSFYNILLLFRATLKKGLSALHNIYDLRYRRTGQSKNIINKTYIIEIGLRACANVQYNTAGLHLSCGRKYNSLVQRQRVLSSSAQGTGGINVTSEKKKAKKNPRRVGQVFIFYLRFISTRICIGTPGLGIGRYYAISHVCDAFWPGPAHVNE